jgi:hypothetical protein
MLALPLSDAFVCHQLKPSGQGDADPLQQGSCHGPAEKALDSGFAQATRASEASYPSASAGCPAGLVLLRRRLSTAVVRKLVGAGGRLFTHE